MVQLFDDENENDITTVYLQTHQMHSAKLRSPVVINFWILVDCGETK